METLVASNDDFFYDCDDLGKCHLAIGFVLLSASFRWLSKSGSQFGGWHLRRSGRQTDASVSAIRKLRINNRMDQTQFLAKLLSSPLLLLYYQEDCKNGTTSCAEYDHYIPIIGGEFGKSTM